MAAQSLEDSSSVIAVVGPTASGKTALAVELAKRLDGELVCADSRQMYRLLDAGTAKPTPQELQGVACHLLDVVDPSQSVDAAAFAAMAKEALAGIRARGRRPILVGGTGLYLRALLEGLDPLPPRSQEIRERLAELVELNGPEYLHERLQRIDPAAASGIPARNVHRVVRALEVYELTGKPISGQWTGKKASDAFYVGIQWDRAALEERVRERAARMFPAILKETAALVPARYKGNEPGFQSLGYPEALAVLRGEMTEPKGLESMIRGTMAYAKRQATWFRKQVSVHWIDGAAGDAAAWADQLQETL